MLPRKRLSYVDRHADMTTNVIAALRETALALGAKRAEPVSVGDIRTDNSFRALCESNACGNYGRNYMCPPAVGAIDELILRLCRYKTALVYQTVGELEDSYDFDGMMEAGRQHNGLGQHLWDMTDELGVSALHLGAGGCRLCGICAMQTGEPCRHPTRAMPSMEAYGIDVTALAALAGMPYVNGQNTVTYFGVVLI